MAQTLPGYGDVSMVGLQAAPTHNGKARRLPITRAAAQCGNGGVKTPPYFLWPETFRVMGTFPTLPSACGRHLP